MIVDCFLLLLASSPVTVHIDYLSSTPLAARMRINMILRQIQFLLINIQYLIIIYGFTLIKFFSVRNLQRRYIRPFTNLRIYLDPSINLHGQHCLKWLPAALIAFLNVFKLDFITFDLQRIGYVVSFAAVGAAAVGVHLERAVRVDVGVNRLPWAAVLVVVGA